jgi:hypothetical protein
LGLAAYAHFLGANAVVSDELTVHQIRHLVSVSGDHGSMANAVPFPAVPPADVVP